MQFGRIHGIALIVLGVILIGLQFNLALASKNGPPQPVAPSSVTVQPHDDAHRFGPLAGIIGGVSLVAGIAVFATAHRRDEPAHEHQVK
jgi:hypothetical protein